MSLKYWLCNIYSLSFRRKAQTDVQCPVGKGNYVVKQTVALPKEIPRGAMPSSSSCPCHSFGLVFLLAKFAINAHGYTVDEDDLFCVNLNVDFMKRPFFKLPFGR
jgi:hypothetical protein